MARIDLQREVTAIGLGVGDELAEFIDRNRGLTKPFRNLTDWYRLGAAALGGIMITMDMGRGYSDLLLYNGSTLAVKSVSRLVRTGVGATAFRGIGAERRRYMLPEASERVRVEEREEISLVVV